MRITKVIIFVGLVGLVVGSLMSRSSKELSSLSDDKPASRMSQSNISGLTEKKVANGASNHQRAINAGNPSINHDGSGPPLQPRVGPSSQGKNLNAGGGAGDSTTELDPQKSANSKNRIKISTFASLEEKSHFFANQGKNYPEDFRKDALATSEPLVIVGSSDPKIPIIDIKKLKTNCQDLRQIRSPTVLAVSADGRIQEAVPLEDVPISDRIFDCSFEGGPNSPYQTTYYPEAFD